jgi:drug/metabolite transporter (DMT)-like permease
MQTRAVTTAIRPVPVVSPVRGTTLIIFSSVCFGTSGPIAKAVMDAGLSPEQVASVRIWLGAVVLLVGTALCRPKALRIARREVPALLVYGLIGVAIVQLLYFVTVSRVPIGIAMLLEYLSPVLVTLWVRFVRGTRLARAVWLGIGLAVTGLVLVAQVWHGLALDTVGVVAGLGTAACSATYFLLGERGVAASDPVGVTTWGLVVGAVTMTVLAPPWTVPTRLITATATLGPLHAPAWQLLVAMAVVATSVAYLTGMAALRHLPSNVVSVLSLVEPLMSIALAWALLGQALAPVQVIGGVVLLTGAVLVQVSSRAGPNSGTDPAGRVGPDSGVRPGSPSARSSAGDGTSPPPTDPRPAAPPARSGGCR